MNINSGEARLVLRCPAWRKWGTPRVVKPGTTILHSRADDVVPFADSEELIRNSGPPAFISSLALALYPQQLRAPDVFEVVHALRERQIQECDHPDVDERRQANRQIELQVRHRPNLSAHADHAGAARLLESLHPLIEAVNLSLYPL